MHSSRIRSVFIGGVLAVVPAAPLSAQTTVTIPPIDFSGQIFGNYQYRTDERAKDFNKFDLERVYLTFRMPAGDRASIRVTTDVYQQQNAPNDAYYAGWAVRMKFAYLDYRYLTGGPAGFSGSARMGIINNVIIDHDEEFWPRWISQTLTDRMGLMSPADGGVGTTLTLPNRLGEIYALVSNGSGYTSRETDRFKDPAIRVTLTPLANSKSRLLSTWSISPWYYKGEVASRFVAGGVGQVGAVGEGLRRDRWGVLTGLRDPRFTLGAHYVQFTGESETGNNTAAIPRVVVDSTGHALSLYGFAHPLAFLDTSQNRLGAVVRYDKIVTNTTTDAAYHVFIAGLTYDLTKRAAVSVDYQEQLTDEATTVGAFTTLATPPLKTWFVHMVANF